MTTPAYDYLWFWRKRFPDRHNHPLRVIAWLKKNSVLIEFESDHYRVVTSRFAIRKRKPLP